MPSASDPPEGGDISLSLDDDAQHPKPDITDYADLNLHDEKGDEAVAKKPTNEADVDNAEPATGDISGAEWSTTITPADEQQQSDFSATRHRRLDSLPPQRFEEETVQWSRRPSAMDAGSHRIDESAEDMGNDSHASEFERAGLDFVDINLGGDRRGADGARSPGLNAVYGPGGAASSKSRTSLEIRTDSISSDFKGPASSETPSSSTTSSKLAFWKRKGTQESAAIASPVGPTEQPTPEVTMLVANDEGDIHRAASPAEQQAQETEASPSQEGQLHPPEPKATTNDSQVALDVKDHERAGQEAAAKLEQGRVSDSSKSQAATISAGRSAGPSGYSEADAEAAQSDVRAESSAEAAARAAAAGMASAGGRSAGPAANVVPTLSVSSGTAPTLAISTSAAAKSGGRSSGPITSPSSAAAGPSSPPSSSHVRKPSGGPSALERYMSRTRQATLPPKTRKEDQRHLQDFESMMKSFQALEAKRLKEDQDRQKRREEELAAATKVWESEILRGDWRAARVKGSRLRLVWWKGCPPSLRGRAWLLAIGNVRMLPRNLATTTKARVKEMKAREGAWPPRNVLNEQDTAAEEAMEEDIERTLPSLKLFQRDGGVLYDDLKETLECLVLLRAEQAAEIHQERQRRPEGQRVRPPAATAATSSASSSTPRPNLYEPGLSPLAALLLLNLSPSETLLSLLNLLATRPWLRSLYSMDPTHLAQSSAFERVLNTLLSDQLPKVYANLQHCGVDPSQYARSWVKTMFIPLLPLETVCRLWDQILLEEAEDEIDSMVFRACLALVGLLSSRLHTGEAKELQSILTGRNRAALSVWYRFVGQTAQLGSGGPALAAAQGASGQAAASAQAVASLPPDSPLKRRVSEAGGSGPGQAEMRASTSSSSVGANGSAIAEESEDESEGSEGKARANGQEEPSTPASASNGVSPPQPSDPDPSSIEAPLSWVPRDSLFSIYAIGETNLFRALEEQVGDDLSSNDASLAGGDAGSKGSATPPASAGVGASASGGGQWNRGDGWWRDSTLKRLVERELGG